MLADRNSSVDPKMTQRDLENGLKLRLILCQPGLPGLDGQKSGVEKVNARVANTKKPRPLFPSLHASS